MFGFRRKQKAPALDTASTFVEATGGGWTDLPDTLSGDGGLQADFVSKTLEGARAYALENDIVVGQKFKYRITDIPTGISNPFEIVAGLMMQAQNYGLGAGTVVDETATFIRLN